RQNRVGGDWAKVLPVTRARAQGRTGLHLVTAAAALPAQGDFAVALGNTLNPQRHIGQHYRAVELAVGEVFAVGRHGECTRVRVRIRTEPLAGAHPPDVDGTEVGREQQFAIGREFDGHTVGGRNDPDLRGVAHAPEPEGVV